MAELQHISQEHQPVTVAEGLEQRRSRLRAAQHVIAAARTEVQVGDDQRSQGLGPS